MHFRHEEGEMEEQFRVENKALQELLTSACSGSGAERVLVVSPADKRGKRTILADSSGPPDGNQETYEEAGSDVYLDLTFGGRSVGGLVFANPNRDLPRVVFDAYAASAGFILGYGGEQRDAARAAEESQVLRQLGLKLGEPTDLSQMLQATVNGARQLLDADYVALATIAADGTSRWISMSGNKTDAYKRTVFPSHKGMAAKVVDAREPIVIERFTDADGRPSDEFPIHIAEGGVTAFVVPIMRGGKPFGALIVGSRKPRRWKAHEIQLGMVLGNAAAVSISQVQESAAERAQRAFFEKVIEDFPGVLIVLSPPDFRIVRANSAVAELLDEPYRSGESVVGRTLKELSTADWSERSEASVAMLQRVADTGEAISFQQYPSEDARTGTQKYWNWTAAPITSPGDEQPLVMLIAQDITEVVEAQQKEKEAGEIARARAEELETVIHQMVDGVIIFDSEGKILKWNPASETLLGRRLLPDGKRGSFPKSYGLFTVDGVPYDPDQLPSTMALRGETVTGAQLLVKRPDGTEVILSASAAPLVAPEGSITGAVTVIRDITQDKIAERMKDEFLSVVSHELRTPLSAIMGYSDLMLRGVHGALSERQARALGAVRANADRLLQLINDLLSVSRLESGAVPIEVGPVNLGETIARILTQTRVLVVNAGLTVRNEVPQYGFPLVLADDSRLQQIIENLLSNAIKFTPPGGSITFGAAMSSLPAGEEAALDNENMVKRSSDAQSIVVSVTDTGTGLESDQLARIWDRFYQVDTSAKRQSGGAGLGLAIVRGLVELHGGQIRATSEGTSQGASFTFSLPIASTEVELLSADERTDKAVAFQSRGAEDPEARTVLVVDDDRDQREIICAMLEMDGYRVVLAEDGEEAVKLAQTLLPSAIALDVMLPRSDGWEVLSRLKTEAATRDIPVLIISVVDQQDFGKKLGAEEYLIKPLEATSLRSAVRRLVKDER